MFERFTDRARRVVVVSQEEARRLNHAHIGTEHVLLALLADGDPVVVGALAAAGATPDELRSKVAELAPAGASRAEGHVPFTPRAKKALELALREALQLGHNYISTEHILLGVLGEGEGVASQAIVALGGSMPAVRAELLRLISQRGEPGDLPHRQTLTSAGVPGSPGQVADARQGSKVLDQFGRNFTELARAGKLDPVVGRDRELERVMQILSRRSKNNPVLVGEPGVGKSAVVEGLAQRIASGDVPETLADKQLYSLDLGSMVAGARYRGDFEERIKKVMAEVRSRGDVILFIDEIHTLVGAGAAEGALDASSILKPMLARGELQTVGATTIDEYRKYVAKDAALERRFQPVTVDPPSVDDTVKILAGLRSRYEEHHDVKIADEALVAAAQLADRYIADRFLPDKAIDLIDEAGARMRIKRSKVSPELRKIDAEIAEVVAAKNAAALNQEFESAAELRSRESELNARRAEIVAAEAAAAPAGVLPPAMMGADEVADVLAVWTGIPVGRLTESESTRLLEMEAELHKRIIGQDDAVAAVSRSIRRSRAGVSDPKRPAGSFIFLGPTGVGKTELAKTLAEFLFGDDQALITLDMSEYMEQHAVSRLVGAPPGYVGFDEGGQLTEAVRRKPHSVVLFDEIEKAHPDVFNTLLQILEEGRLTDSQGRSVDFRNTIIILTSNLGTGDLRKLSVGFTGADTAMSYERMKSKVSDALKAHFRPEFLNRIDEVIVFHELAKSEVLSMVDKMLAPVTRQLAERGLRIELTGAAREHLASVGYDPQLGARPLRRAVQREVSDVIAERILFGEFAAGETILVDAFEGSLMFASMPTTAPESLDGLFDDPLPGAHATE